MNKIFDKEVKKIQMEILQNVHDFCVENDINYTLTFGTLLGAIRHRGYIPWDDDIDIAMPYPDYQKFIKLYNLNNQHYKVIDVENDKKFPYIMAKIEKNNTLIKEPNVDYDFGINIDLFPIYGMPNSLEKQEKHFNKIKRLQKLLRFKFIKYNKDRAWYKNFFVMIIRLIIKPFNFYTLRKLIRKYPYDKVKNVKITSFEMKKLSVFPKEYFEQKIKIGFEGQEYYIPLMYENILNSIYGNYMEFPPKEKQISHHCYDAYIVEE